MKLTKGPFGEIINNWPQHPAIEASGKLISLPVDPASVMAILLF